MNLKIFKANSFLFMAALLWGSTFVFQRMGMDHMPPFSFTAIRFSLGALVLFPIALLKYKKSSENLSSPKNSKKLLGIFLAGAVMFIGINFQQFGLVYTTAGNAGLITGLYVVIVPFLGLFLGIRSNIGSCIGAILGGVGLYFLSVKAGFRLMPGDAWVVFSTFAWAAHVLVLAWLSPKMNSYVIACGQAAVCAVLSWALALFTEEITWIGITQAWIPIFWGSVLSVAIGFTCQVIGQKDSPPAHSAIILSLEAVIAAICGWLILNEIMSSRAIFGASLMVIGMLISQLWTIMGKRADAPMCRRAKGN